MLKAGRIRFIGEPLERIAEDHLRILRFFRFHARFGKGEPDPAALAACTARANDLMALSRERIADELLKLLGMPAPSPTVAIMLDRGILKSRAARNRDRPRSPRSTASSRPNMRRISTPTRSAACRPCFRAIRSLAEKSPSASSSPTAPASASPAPPTTDLAANPHALAYRTGLPCATDRLLLADRPAEAAALAGLADPQAADRRRRARRPRPYRRAKVARTLKAIEDAWVDAGFPTGEAFKTIVGDALAR